MLTISQLAAYAGVTVRAVRHYHQVGLMPEPERDASGYRTYTAADVVRLIKVRTLAEAGVPLARVQDLLSADEEEFAAAVAEIDRRLRAQMRELQEHRRRIAQLAAGDSLALPPEVVEYLDKLRATGAPEALVQGERDGWILMAARWPEQIPLFMEDKMRRLDDPRMVQLNAMIDQEDWHTIGLTELADVTKEWKEFTYSFRAEQTAKAKNRISFLLGSEKGKVWLKDVTLKGAWTGPAALTLQSHALAPLNELPVLEVVSGVHIIADLTLDLGKVVHDYLA